MPGTPRYPDDLATNAGSARRAARATTGSAQTRVPYARATALVQVDATQVDTAQITAATSNLGAASATTLTVTGDASVGDDLTVTDDLLVGGDLQVNGGLILDGETITGALLGLLLDPPYTILVKGATQSIPDQDLTTVLTYTAPIAGIYSVTAAVPWANDPDGRREASIMAGGVTFEGSSVHSSANTKIVTPVCALAELDATDVIDLNVWHSAGNALNVLAATRLEVIWQRPL